MTAELIVLGWGNPSRGDDALAPLLCERLEAWLPTSPVARRIEVVQDFQLQVEHALDLVDRRLVLFIDAAADLAAPYRFGGVEPGGAFGPSSHAISPASVLDVYERIRGEAPPPAFLLAVGGESFALGAALSAPATRNLAAAWGFLQQLCGSPDAASWHAWRAGRP